MNIRAILFDKDGTLIDFEQTWQPVYKAVALHLSDGDHARADAMMIDAGFDPALNRCLPGSLLSVGTTDQLIDLWRGDLDREARLRAIEETDDMFTAGAAENMTPIGDLRALLGDLKLAGHTLGIATNDVMRSAHACVEQFELGDLFAFVTGYDGVENAKPAPDMAHAFCTACNLDVRDIAVVGDNVHDLEMGRAAGAGLLVGVLSGTGAEADLDPHADVVLPSIVELAETLAAMR
jgi:phosphoglycolate phosphatase